MPLWAKIDPGWMFALGVALLAAILLRRHFRYRQKLKRESRDNLPVKSSRLATEGIVDQPLADAPAQMLRWQVEMHDTARDLKAELDSKISILQALVRIADERIDALQRAREYEGAAGADRLDDISRLTDELSDDLRRAARGEATPIETDDATCGASLPGSEASRAEVAALADQGFDAETIAIRTGQPLADVELMMGMM